MWKISFCKWPACTGPVCQRSVAVPQGNALGCCFSCFEAIPSHFTLLNILKISCQIWKKQQVWAASN